MNYQIKKEKVEDVFESMIELEKLLTERIAELHNVEGGKQARHAYMFYRRVLWDAKHTLKNNLKDVNKPKN